MKRSGPVNGEPPAAPALFEEVVPIRHASRGVVRELGFLEDINAEAGVSHSEAHALIEIGESDPMVQGDLGKLLRLDKSTTSRIVAGLVGKGWVRARKAVDDGRRSSLSLTESGRRRLGMVHGPANARVQLALATLGPEERGRVLDGLMLYARALRATRLQEEFQLRTIRKEDDAALADIINRCLAEFGAGGPGFANADPEFRALSRAYQKPRSAYFVVCREERVLGGGGVAPLKGGDAKVCEFQKMYLLPETRGFGLGQRIVEMCLSTARALGYQRCYLETLTSMKAARALYEKNGFRRLKKPAGATGHFGCDAWYARRL